MIKNISYIVLGEREREYMECMYVFVFFVNFGWGG